MMHKSKKTRYEKQKMLSIVLVVLAALLLVVARRPRWLSAAANYPRDAPWVDVRVVGATSRGPLVVRSAYAHFRQHSRLRDTHYVDSLPYDPMHPVLTVAYGTERLTIDVAATSSPVRLDGGALTIEVRRPTPASPWRVSDDLLTTRLPHGCVLMSDRDPTATRDAILLPGRGLSVRSREQLLFYRSRSVRLHVFYYEAHTFAAATDRLEGSLASLAASVADLEAAVARVDATALIGYSLGGLVASLYLKRHAATTPVTRLVLLAPYLAGSPLVRALPRQILPRVRDRPVLDAHLLVSVNHADYWRWRYPLAREPPNDYPYLSLDLLRACEASMRELRDAPGCVRVPTLLLSSRYDDVLSSAAVEASARAICSDLRVRRLELDHAVWPCRMDDDEDLVRSHVASFL